MVTAIRPLEPISLPTAAPCRVFLIRNDSLLWLGLRSLLSDTPRITVVGEATTVSEAVRVAAALHPDLIVLPGALAGVGAPSVVGHLRAQLPTARFIVLLDELAPELVVALDDAAIAVCLLLSEITPAVLQRTLAAAHTGGDDASLLWSRPVRDALFAAYRTRDADSAPAGTVPLTPRQQQVLALMATGLTDQAVAVQLGLTPSTVASHIHELSARVGATNRFQIGWLARELGLVSRKELLSALGDRQPAHIG